MTRGRLIYFAGLEGLPAASWAAGPQPWGATARSTVEEMTPARIMPTAG